MLQAAWLSLEGTGTHMPCIDFIPSRQYTASLGDAPDIVEAGQNEAAIGACSSGLEKSLTQSCGRARGMGKTCQYPTSPDAMPGHASHSLQAERAAHRKGFCGILTCQPSNPNRGIRRPPRRRKRAAHCEGVRPGKARVFTCLLAHIEAADYGAACRDQLAAQQERRCARLAPRLRPARRLQGRRAQGAPAA